MRHKKKTLPIASVPLLVAAACGGQRGAVVAAAPATASPATASPVVESTDTSPSPTETSVPPAALWPPPSPLPPPLGPSDSAVVQAFLKENVTPFRRCYEEGLAREPYLSGLVATKVVVEADGHVSSSTLVGIGPAQAAPMQDPAVVSCVVRAFASLRFPKLEGSHTEFVYPIIFNRRN